MIQPSDIGARRFAHQAMHTEFEIFCVHADGCLLYTSAVVVALFWAHRNRFTEGDRSAGYHAAPLLSLIHI